MLIVIEGLDNTGKTTLSNFISETFKFEYLHSNRKKTKTEMLEYVYDLSEISNSRNIVMDRFPLVSEFVYGPIVRNQLLLSIKDFFEAWKHILVNMPFIIFCEVS